METRQHAVDKDTRTLNFVSVSQLGKFDSEQDGGCGARWYFRYVEGKKEPERAATDTGTKAHSRIEHFEKTGEDVLGKIERPGKHLLMTGPGLLVEWGMNDEPKPAGKNHHAPENSLLEADGVKVVGFMDLVNPLGVYLTNEGKLEKDPDGTVEVIDHKTSGDAAKWAKQPEQFLATNQMPGYGAWVRQKFPWVTGVRLSHNYFDTKVKLAFKKTKLFSLEQIEEAWYLRGHAVAREMKGVAKADSHKDVPANLAACSQYGGCPFRSDCSHYKNANVYTRLRNAAKPKGNLMALMSKAKAQLKSTPTPPPTGSNGSTGPQAASLTAKQAEQNKLYKIPSGATAMFICATSGKFSFIPVDDKGTPTGAPTLLEPESPISVATLAPAPTPAPPPAAETKAEAKPETKKTTKKTDAAPAAEGITLYVNCTPGSGFRSLDGYIAQITSALAEAHKVDDIRFPPNADHALAFDRWKGALAATVRKSPPENGPWVAVTGDTLTDVVIAAVTPLASSVVRAIR